MVTFKGNLTNPPKISTSDPTGTLFGWVGFTLVIGVMFVALGVAQNLIAPAIGNGLSMVGIGSGEETTDPGFAFGGDD